MKSRQSKTRHTRERGRVLDSNNGHRTGQVMKRDYTMNYNETQGADQARMPVIQHVKCGYYHFRETKECFNGRVLLRRAVFAPGNLYERAVGLHDARFSVIFLDERGLPIRFISEASIRALSMTALSPISLNRIAHEQSTGQPKSIVQGIGLMLGYRGLVGFRMPTGKAAELRKPYDERFGHRVMTLHSDGFDTDLRILPGWKAPTDRMDNLAGELIQAGSNARECELDIFYDQKAAEKHKGCDLFGPESESHVAYINSQRKQLKRLSGIEREVGRVFDRQVKRFARMTGLPLSKRAGDVEILSFGSFFRVTPIECDFAMTLPAEDFSSYDIGEHYQPALFHEIELDDEPSHD